MRASEAKFKSPCLPFWIKEFLNLRSVFLKEKFAICKFINFKTLLTRLSRLLNLGLVATRH
ncbi:hypothetical protein ATCC51561_316 [Campylobacter concisus ATCC 51561]|nr:hypothetical protein ATCC51561_316 [Campylobacter concisus ATCC 51561]